MRAFAGIAGLVLVLGVGYYIYSVQLVRLENNKPEIGQIDMAGIRSDLLSLAQAERYYLAANGNYATLEELKKSPPVSNLPRTPRRGYTYELQIDGESHFVITARPAAADLQAYSIDETMTITAYPAGK